jgi:hypothetical protein
MDGKRLMKSKETTRNTTTDQDECSGDFSWRMRNVPAILSIGQLKANDIYAV